MTRHVDRTDRRPSPSEAIGVARLPVLLLVILMLLSACGGSDGGAEPDDTTTTTAPASTSQDGVATTAAPTTAAPDTTQAGEGDAVAVSTATVEIAGETYEFQETGFIIETCDTSFFGGAQVILLIADDNGEPLIVESQTKSLSIVLIPEEVDDRPAAVNLGTMDADLDWIADPERVEGTGVDSWSIDGNRVEGTATFASTAGEGPIQGTFEVTCAEE